MKMLLTGDEAIARGAWEAGVTVAAAYPGTPSTEIMQALSDYPEVKSQWSINEKVAMETASGAAIGGARALTSMKHVGLNVAADPFFTMSYIGVRGGFVVVTADDPGMHSSQNEQDNRHFARAAKVPMLEPSDSQEARDFTKLAFELSERFDTPWLLRITTRIAHSTSVVEVGDRQEVGVKPYQKDFVKQVMLPSSARVRHPIVEQRTLDVLTWARESGVNRIEWGDTETGIVTSGVSYAYVREVFPDATVLKYNLTWPLDTGLAEELRAKVKNLVVVEEGDPFLEEQIKAAGVAVDVGKNVLPLLYEYNPELLREKLKGEKPQQVAVAAKAPPRPPALCPGCGHRAMFYALKREKAMVLGDIGCYTLAALPPLQSMDTCICMGASISASIGMAKAMEAAGKNNEKIACIIGDSTFMHSGVTGLIDAVFNRARFVTIILDNSITAMTGHQNNPVTGKDLHNEPTFSIDLVTLGKACGIPEDRISVFNPTDMKAGRETLKKHWQFDGPSLIIAKSTCVIAQRFMGRRHVIETELCKSCGACVQLGCPAISYNDKKASIDPTLCVGCTMCAQVCAHRFIHPADEQYVPVDKPQRTP